METMIQSKIINKEFSSEGTTECVSLAEAKAHLYIDSGNSDFDSLITSLIPQVREYLENLTGLSLIDRTVTLWIDYESSFTIPYGPVTTFSSASVKTFINTYDAQVINDDFEVEAGRFISYVGNYRFKLIYEAGYTTATIPAGLKLGFLNEIARRFEHRGDNVIVGDTNEIVTPYKLVEWLI